MAQADHRPFGLAGRVAWVTGAASGIGFGIAEVLAEAGARVMILDRDGDTAAARAADLPGGAGAIALDLADEASVVAGCAEALARGGPPWALVNNAGLQDRELLLDATVAEWDRINAVNARGPFLATREAGRAMAAAGRGGRIVNVASTALTGSLVRGLAAYASSKAALVGLTRASAMELAEHAVTVNLVLPGGVATPGAVKARGPAPEGPARRRPPLGFCEPRDIGAAVLFLASPAARYVTNQAIAVDAGWSVT